MEELRPPVAAMAFKARFERYARVFILVVLLGGGVLWVTRVQPLREGTYASMSNPWLVGRDAQTFMVFDNPYWPHIGSRSVRSTQETVWLDEGDPVTQSEFEAAEERDTADGGFNLVVGADGALVSIDRVAVPDSAALIPRRVW